MWSASFHVHLATKVLNQGGVISYPTESVFGLGCDPHNSSAIAKLLTLKNRSASKGVILIASHIDQLKPWVDFDSLPNMESLLNSWPGFETWIVPAFEGVSPLLTGAHDTLAVRVSAHPVVQKLCHYFGGAITSTSANINNQTEATNQFAVKRIFGQRLDYSLPGETLGRQRPSRIRDAFTGDTLRS